MSEKGFTLIEMLVSIVIFSIVILAVYSLFTQSQWIHTGSEKRSNIQDQARLTLEQMERDFRMIGFGVPQGDYVGDGGFTIETWVPAIFDATQNRISFTADMDMGNANVSADAGTERGDYIFVNDTSYYTGATGSNLIPIVITSKGNAWEDAMIEGIYNSSVNAGYTALDADGNLSSPGSFSALASDVYTLERVFYRMIGDSDNDGVCSDETYPFCTIERQELTTNDPDDVTPDPDDWAVVGTHVTSLELTFLESNGDDLDPAVDDLSLTSRILINLTCRDRDIIAGGYQSYTLESEVMIRNEAL